MEWNTEAPRADAKVKEEGQNRLLKVQWARRALLALLAFMFMEVGAAAVAFARPLQVVTDIRPIQALLTALVAGTEVQVHRLLPENADPHHAALRPSAMRRLAAADLVFVVALDLSPQLARALRNRPPRARVMELARARGVALLPRRRLDPPGVPTSPPAGTDWHVWTDPRNIASMARAAAQALAEADSELASRVQANLEHLKRRLAVLEKTLAQQLSPLAGRAYLLVHDATQYLERRYGLAPVAIVQPDHETPPAPRRLAALMRLVRQYPGICVLAPPGGAQRWARRLATAGEMHAGVIDVLGLTLDPANGTDFWIAYFQTLSRAYHDCLSQAPHRR